MQPVDKPTNPRMKGILVACALAGLAGVCTAVPPSMASPDRALRAVAVVSGPGRESRIEIRQKDAVLLAQSYTSPDGQHGFVLEQAQWTANSRFFVFSMSSSGGHQPWRYPVFVYSRRHNALEPLEKITGPITGPDFQLTAGGSIAVAVQSGNDRPRKTWVRLAALFAAKP